MKKRIIALFLVAVMVLSLTACSSSSTTTTTFSTSYTDENGETTTNTTTTTTENGQIHTEEVTTTTFENEDSGDTEEPEDEAYEVDESDISTLRDQWADYFEYGAEGETNEGETVLFTYDNPDPLSQAALMIISPDDVLTYYDVGSIREEEDCYVIEDVEGEEELPFAVTDTADDHFEMTFQDGSYAELYYVDKDTIIDDMVSIIEQVSNQ